jgi:hypothetical protein
MKKLLLVCSCFLSVLVVAQVTEKPYEFPVKPGTEQWAKLSSSSQMDEVCVIHDQVLRKLSTRALLITCLNYPRIIDVFSADNLQSGFDLCSTHFNGLAELLKRPDLNQILLKFYLDVDIQKNTIEGYNAKFPFLPLAFVELFLAQNNILKQFDNKDKSILLSEAIKNLEIRKSKGESLYHQITTALILSRLINIINQNLFETNDYQKEIFKTFNSYAVVLDTTLINEIFIASKSISIKY